MRFSRIRFLAAASLALLALAPVVFGGASLTALPKVYSQNNPSLTQAVGMLPAGMTPDGQYVGGTGNLGFATTPTSTNAIGFVYDAVNGSRQPLAGSYQATVNGIGYRVMGDGSKQLVIGGNNAGWASMNYSTDGGATWVKVRSTDTTRPPGYPYPSPSGLNTVAGSGGLNVWSTWWTPNSSTPNLFIDAHDGTNYTSLPDKKGTTAPSNVMGVSSAGVAVGMRQISAVNNNYVLTFDGDGTPAAAFTDGLAGAGDTRGTLYDIADDGSYAGGFSPVSDGRTGQWPYVRNMSTGAVTELPLIVPNATPSATNGVVYGLAPNGQWAVGMDYSLGLEKAVLWDLRNINAVIVTDLTQYATDHGILGDFSGNLRRAYAVGINAQGDVVITGIGSAPGLEANGWTGFVLVYPLEPQGACCVQTGPYSFTCSITGQADCTGTWTEGKTCAEAGCGPCGMPWADADHDGDVDSDDFGFFQDCFTGDGAFALSNTCKCLDRNKNNAVDSNDLIEFEKCATGAMVLFTPALDPNCTPGNSQLP